MASKKIDKPVDSDGFRDGERANQAAAMLREIILSGELAPGERLGVAVISERLGLSRTPVREAFRTLAAENLVEFLPNRMIVVRTANPREIADAFAVLAALEELAGQYACRQMTGEQIEALTELQEQLEAQFAAGDHCRYSQSSRLFHRLIVEGSCNPALISAWRMVLPLVQRAWTLKHLDPGWWRQSHVEHRELLGALAARDATLLASLVKSHFSSGVPPLKKRVEVAVSDSESVGGSGRPPIGGRRGYVAKWRRRSRS